MAESNPSLGMSILEGSDNLPDTFCEPCYAASDKVKPVAGYCTNCDEKLCRECFTSHIGHTLFRSHKLVKTSATLNIHPTTKNVFKNMTQYMPTVAIIIVAIVLTSILNFHTEEMSKLAKNIENSHDIRNLKDVVNDVKKLRNEFVNLMTKTEKQAEFIKKEHFTKIEKIVIEQINKLTVQLETLKDNNENGSLFTAMQHAQFQLQSMEEKLNKLDKDKNVKKVKAILKVKRPFHVKDITATASSDKPFHLHGSLILPNNQILITDWDNKKLKLIDKNQDKIMSEIQLPGNSYGITKVREDEVAVTLNNPNTIKFISLSENVMSVVREVTVDGQCNGIDYNDRDNTLIVTFINPPKVKILDMKGKEIKCIEYDSEGNKLFGWPFSVAVSPDMTSIYVTDWGKDSVTLLSLNGDVKDVYKSDTLKGPEGIYVHTSGLVYVVGRVSRTVHELDPESGEIRVILELKDELHNPWSISYCEFEDTMYIGMAQGNVLKVFEMKYVT